MTDLNHFNSNRGVPAKNRKFESIRDQETRTPIYKVFLSTIFPPAIPEDELRIGKVQTASVQTEKATGCLFWNPIYFVPVEFDGRPVEFSAFGRSWKLFRSNPKPKSLPTFVIVAEFDGDRTLVAPGVSNVPYIPKKIESIIREIGKKCAAAG